VTNCVSDGLTTSGKKQGAGKEFVLPGAVSGFTVMPASHDANALTSDTPSAGIFFTEDVNYI